MSTDESSKQVKKEGKELDTAITITIIDKNGKIKAVIQH